MIYNATNVFYFINDSGGITFSVFILSVLASVIAALILALLVYLFLREIGSVDFVLKKQGLKDYIEIKNNKKHSVIEILKIDLPVMMECGELPKKVFPKSNFSGNSERFYLSSRGTGHYIFEEIKVYYMVYSMFGSFLFSKIIRRSE